MVVIAVTSSQRAAPSRDRLDSSAVRDPKRSATIARALNDEGIRTDRGSSWTRGTVQQLLTNEKYIGQNIFNRVSFKLKKKRVRNPPEMWVRDEDAFESIIDQAAFHTVRGIILARHRRLSDDEMLERLKGILEQRGKLSGVLIDELDEMPSAAAYRHRFGSLLQAYQLVGFSPDRDYAFMEANRQLRAVYPRLVDDVVRSLSGSGARVERDPDTDLMTVNEQLRVSLVLSRYEQTSTGSPRWTIRFDRSLEPDLTIAVRMDSSNSAALDYYILPSLDVRAERLRVAHENFFGIDAYRYDSLDHLFGLGELVTIEVAA
ncbi:MAG: recombinase family protein [Labilithrix sp.]|nr:recombinase family protein [Labilithrix sp.]